MNVLEQLYEGKAKRVYRTDDDALYMVEYKDDATAFNGEKKASIHNKGILNNHISTILFEALAAKGIPSHFVQQTDDTHMLVKRVEIIMLEVIVRNIAAGSFSKRLGIEEGTTLSCPTLEFCYKNDSLGDPMINHYHALALGLASQEEIDAITNQALAINKALQEIFGAAGLTLVDFKLEFGRLPDGTVVLADEISPDTCRLWDSKTHEKLDKDRFRRDLGNVEEAYQEVLKRLRVNQ